VQGEQRLAILEYDVDGLKNGGTFHAEPNGAASLFLSVAVLIMGDHLKPCR
jgi:hypothetical protein